MKALYSLILFTSIAAPSSALQGGDSCSSPTAISGVGTFNFDCTSDIACTPYGGDTFLCVVVGELGGSQGMVVAAHCFRIRLADLFGGDLFDNRSLQAKVFGEISDKVIAIAGLDGLAHLVVVRHVETHRAAWREAAINLA